MTRFLDETDRWLRELRRGPDPAVRLVCFPHAGGTANFFQTWPRGLPSDVDVLAVRYPGRQDRLQEPCVDRMDPLVDRITAALVPYLDRPVALFGHSMGSSVAYEVALRLESRYGIDPVVLLVSGQGAPHVSCVEPAPDSFDDDALFDRIGALGEVDAAVFRSSKLRELIMPAIRADLRLIHRYLPREHAKVATPIAAFTGSADPACPVEAVTSWAEVTTGGFRMEVFSGDHFYLVPHQAEVLARVSERLAENCRWGVTRSWTSGAEPSMVRHSG